MAATLTGTPTVITWASGQNPAGQSITIPSDATAVYMFWTFFHATDGHGLASVTLNGNNPSQTFEMPTGGSGLYVATGVAAWYNPATGSRTLDPSWDAAPAEGPTTIIAYIKGGDTTAWRDADADQDEDRNAVSVTLTTVSGDLVIKYDQKFVGPPNFESVPSLTSTWSSGQTGSNVNEGVRLSYISATTTTQVCDSEDENYSSIVAISIPTEPAGGGNAHSHYYRMLNS